MEGFDEVPATLKNRVWKRLRMTDREVAQTMLGEKIEIRRPVPLKTVEHPVDCVVHYEADRPGFDAGWYAVQLGGVGNGQEGPRRIWKETRVVQDIFPGDIAYVAEPIVLYTARTSRSRVGYPATRQSLGVRKTPTIEADAAMWTEFNGKRLDGRRVRDWMYRTRVRVVEVGVERLQAISRESLIREGVSARELDLYPPLGRFDQRWNRDVTGCYWIDNPWVWVIRFCLHSLKRHIDGD